MHRWLCGTIRALCAGGEGAECLDVVVLWVLCDRLVVRRTEERLAGLYLVLEIIVVQLVLEGGHTGTT